MAQAIQHQNRGEYLDNVKLRQMSSLPGVILRSGATKNLVVVGKAPFLNETVRFAQSDIT